MKLIYILRKYLYEILTTLVAITVSVITFTKFFWNTQFLIIIEISIYLLALVIILYIRQKDKDLYFTTLTKRRHVEDWIGKGKFEYSKIYRCFLITNSDAGFIFSKCFLWNNYKFSFEFKIIRSCIGAVIRAINLSNYVMIQLTPDKIRPHIRVNGGWYIWEETDVKILSFDKWYKCSISCEQDFISVKIFDTKNRVFDRVWKIPQGNINFKFGNNEGKKSIIIPFPINLEYGTVGFRNWGDEAALVRNVLIEKI